MKVTDAMLEAFAESYVNAGAGSNHLLPDDDVRAALGAALEADRVAYPHRATVLVQAADPGPGACDRIVAALEPMPEIVDLTPTLGAYDAVAVIESPTIRGLGPTVVRIQGDETVGRTLTLAHRTQTDTPEDET